MALVENIVCYYKFDEESTPCLYNIEGIIELFIKNMDSINNGISFRQIIQSLPPVITGHMIYQDDNWINAGALIAEHLTRKFVPRALNWIDNVDSNSMELKYHFNTHIKGFSWNSYDSSNGKPQILRGTSIAEWNQYPYRIEYKFRYNISSVARKNCKWLGYQNYPGYKLRDKRYKTYIQAIINSQSTQVFDWMYNVDKAIEAVMFLVE